MFQAALKYTLDVKVIFMLANNVQVDINIVIYA